MSFIPYQVDYSVKNAAKTLGFSKKKVTFAFGFANQQAIDDGLTGAACRGSEHQVTFIWSLTSGKRQLFLDGKEMHFSESRQNGWVSDREWQHVFRLRDSATGSAPLKAHFVSQTVNRDIPGSVPFDLRVGGVSYFRFNQIFQLGTPAMTVRTSSSGSRRDGGDNDPFISPEERRLIAQAKLESLKDLERQSSPNRPAVQSSESMNRDEGALISFDDDPVPPPTAQPYHQQQRQPPPALVGNSAPPANGGMNYFASSLTLDTAIDDSTTPRASTTPQYGVAGAFGAPPPPGGPSPYGYSTNPYAPQQQSSYGGPPPSTASTATPTTSNAMMPYQPPAGQPAPSPYAVNPGYGMTSQQQPPPMTPSGYSTSNMSTGGFSSYTYGSAPSFAQPPRQQPPQFAQPPQQQPYGQQYPSQYPPQQQPPSYY